MRMPKAEGQARKFISSNQWDLLKCRVLPRRWVCLSVASAAEALDLFEASTRPARCGTCQADRPESVSGCGSCRLELARACEATAVDDRVSKVPPSPCQASPGKSMVLLQQKNTLLLVGNQC